MREGGEGLAEQGAQFERQLALDQHADHAQRMAAQREGIAVAGRQVADAEHAHQGFELVGQRDHDADGIARQLVAREARLVVVFDRVGHRGIEPVVQRVVAAHGALQLGELADHVGHQVGLGQLGGLHRVRRQRAVVDAAPSCSPMACAMRITRCTRSPCVPSLL